MFGEKIFIEDNFPNLIFAKNGEMYIIDNKNVYGFNDVNYYTNCPKEL